MHLKHGAALQGGKYRIEKLLGQGGFGITYLAVQTGLNRKVAIKEFFMKEHCNRDADTSRVSVPSVGSRELVAKFKDKFIREAQMIYDLKHQNIILIRDFFEENGTAYYVMEYHDGGSLGSLPLPLTAEEASVYIRQVASALSYLHERNTMHLDVKPSNVLIDKEGNAVLIDFGISKHYDYAGHQTSSTPVGISKGYAPIEQYSQSTLEFNSATDIYSLGATLCKLLTGDTPPEASLLVSNPKLLIFPSSVSEPMAALIRRCMSPSLAARPQSISEFLGMLDEALAASTGDETKVDSEDDATTVIFGNDKVDVDSGDTSEKKKSRRWLWWLLAVVLLVGVGVVALMSSRSGGEAAEHSGREHVVLQEQKSQATEAQKLESDLRSYNSLMDTGSEYESDHAMLQKALEKYQSAQEVEQKWAESDYSSRFDRDASSALKRVERRINTELKDETAKLEAEKAKAKQERKQYETDLKDYNAKMDDADKKSGQQKYDDALKQYQQAASLENKYKGIKEYSSSFARNASSKSSEMQKKIDALSKQSASEASYSNGVLRVKGVEYPMVWVSGGDFEMGSSSGGSDEKPVHTVSLDGYSIGKYEVTQELWEAVMGSNPSYYKGPRKPVENVSWNDCDHFIRKLNKMTRQNFRLPTEAEWEYAARGGRNQNSYTYSGSNTVGTVAWYFDNSGSQTHEVGGKSPNSLGIHDMSGNVWEWCYDWYGSYLSGSRSNPKGPSSGSSRVLRGGSWFSSADFCRVSDRFSITPDGRSSISGFRLCL